MFKVMPLMGGAIPMLPDGEILARFWIPLLLFPIGLGMAIANERKRRIVGRLLLLLTVLVIASHSAPLSESIEGWSLHLLIILIGPFAALLFGIWIALFSGPIPVAPLPRRSRIIGFALIALSALWFLWMLFYNRPSLDGLDNPWWRHFVTSLLTSLVIFAGFAAAAALIMGDERWREATVMSLLSLSSFGLVIYLLAQGTVGDDPVYWRSASWGALGDLGGMLVGGGFSLLVFVTLVWMGERKLGVPPEVEPLSTTEKERVREILADNLEDSP